MSSVKFAEKLIVVAPCAGSSGARRNVECCRECPRHQRGSANPQTRFTEISRQRGEAVFIVSEMTVTDLETSQQTLPPQAPLYQLCGDHNLLHSDPEIPCGLGLSATDPAALDGGSYLHMLSAVT